MSPKDFFQQIWSKGEVFLTSKVCHLILISAGILLRFKYYFESRSFGWDECYYAVHVLSRSWQEILCLKPVLHITQPQAPVLFYLIEKLIVQRWGNYEYALRLGPLLCGIFAIILFYRLLSKYFEKEIVSIALGLFVFCDHLVLYSVEMKYYSLDLLVCVAVLIFFERYLQDKQFGSREFIWASILGALCMWCSYGTIFILAAMGIVLGISNRKDPQKMQYILLTFVPWAVSFFVLYLGVLRPMTQDQVLLRMWGTYKIAFLPHPFSFKTTLIWLQNIAVNTVRDPLGLSFPLIPIILMGLGNIVLFRKEPRRCGVYVLSISLVVLAASLKMYPFYSRSLIFLVPIFLIFIGEGFVFIGEGTYPLRKVVILIILVLLFQKPVTDCVYYLGHNRYDSKVTNLVEFFKDSYQKGDGIFINNDAFLQVVYYFQKLGVVASLPKQAVVSDKNEKVYEIVLGKFLADWLEDRGRRYMGLQTVFYYVNREGYYRDFSSLNGDDYVIVYQDTKILLAKRRAWLFLINAPKEEQEIILGLFDNNMQKKVGLWMGNNGVFLYESIPHPESNPP